VTEKSRSLGRRSRLAFRRARNDRRRVYGLPLWVDHVDTQPPRQPRRTGSYLPQRINVAGLMFAEAKHPSRIAGHVGAVIVEQVDLDVVFPRTAQESKLIIPAVGINRLGSRVRADMALPGRKPAMRSWLAVQPRWQPGRPRTPAASAKADEPFLVGASVLDDNPCTRSGCAIAIRNPTGPP